MTVQPKSDGKPRLPGPTNVCVPALGSAPRSLRETLTCNVIAAGCAASTVPADKDQGAIQSLVVGKGTGAAHKELALATALPLSDAVVV